MVKILITDDGWIGIRSDTDTRAVHIMNNVIFNERTRRRRTADHRNSAIMRRTLIIANDVVSDDWRGAADRY